MPQILRNLTIHEVSSVDRGAGEGVKIMLMKRLGDDPAVVAKAARVAMVAGLKLAKASTSERVTKLGAIDFDEAQRAVEAGEYADDMMSEFAEAWYALQQSVGSIMCDTEIVDKTPKLDETFDQFKAHIQTVVPEDEESADVRKAITAAGIAVALSAGDAGSTQKGNDMSKLTAEQVAKLSALGLTAEAIAKLAPDANGVIQIALSADQIAKLNGAADLEETKKKLAKAERDLRIASLSPAEHEYAKAAKMDDDAKDEFAAMDEKKRKAKMEADPIEKVLNLPASVIKQLEEGREALAKVNKLAEAGELATFQKRAVAAGEPEALGATIQKAFGGDKDAVEALVKLLEAKNVQLAKGGLFKEFGTRHAQAGGDEALTKMDERVVVLQKAHQGSKPLTKAAAIAKIAESKDPADQEIWKAYKEASQQKAA